MESGTHLPKSIKVLAAALSALLMLFSFMLVGNNSHAASKVMFKTTMTSPATLTVTSTTTTPSPTPTDTPTPTPTDTPTPTPTPKPTHTPTPEPTATPTAKPTERTTVIPPTAAATPDGGKTPGVGTPTPGIDQTPTSVGGSIGVGDTPTTITHGHGGGTPPPKQPGGGFGFGLSLASFITGTLIFLSIVSMLLVGLLVLRRRLMPTPTPKVNLPPSGAQPWTRLRPDSLHGDPTLNDEPLAQPGTTAAMAPTIALIPVDNNKGLPPMGTGAPNTNDNGWPPLAAPLPVNSGWPPPPHPGFWPSFSGFAPGNIGAQDAHPGVIAAHDDGFPLPTGTGALPDAGNVQPASNEMTTAPDAGGVGGGPPPDNPGRNTERIKPPARPAPRLMRLEATESSGSIPAAPAEREPGGQELDKNSDEMASLFDPFLRGS